MTVILYESPQRLHKTLDDISTAWGDRRIAVARELTKRYEEVFRGTVKEAQQHYSEGVRGEVVLVVEGCAERSEPEVEPGDWQEELRHHLESCNLSVKEATEKITRQYRLSRRVVYQEALRIKGS